MLRVVAQKIELLDTGIDIGVVGQMGRIDFIDRRAAWIEQVVGEIGTVGEGRIGRADGPVLDRPEFAIGLHCPSPVLLRVGEGEGHLVELVQP